jgi:hypothetical protein
MNPTTTNQSSWTFGIPEPPKHSQMVKDIIAMEKELADLRSEIGQIIATLEVNYGMDGRRQDGIAVDSKDKRPLMFMIVPLYAPFVHGRTKENDSFYSGCDGCKNVL